EAGPSPYPLDDVLRLNHVQAKGTHNSYHLEPDNPIDPSHRYSHAPLDVQLDRAGVRQFELDLHLHWRDGFHVFHLPQGIDDETTCLRFVDCLELIRDWSDAHPWHLPIVVWIEPKDGDLDFATPDYVEFHTEHAVLEAEILTVYPRWRILTPDDVRGVHPDLPTAIAADGWPTLGALRGKIVFSMLDSELHRERYLEGAPNLAGRLMFVDADTADDPFAAFFKINNARADAAEVEALVSAGFIVTSNVDSADATDADNLDKSTASLAAGAQFLSSDLPEPVPDRTYSLEIPGGTPARCNPVSAPTECTPADIEALP